MRGGGGGVVCSYGVGSLQWGGGVYNKYGDQIYEGAVTVL